MDGGVSPMGASAKPMIGAAEPAVAPPGRGLDLVAGTTDRRRGDPGGRWGTAYPLALLERWPWKGRRWCLANG